MCLISNLAKDESNDDGIFLSMSRARVIARAIAVARAIAKTKVKVKVKVKAIAEHAMVSVRRPMTEPKKKKKTE